MGIPLYYKPIINAHPNIINQLSGNNIIINNLLLDLNCAIHPCCANKTKENEMFKEILQKIKECIKITNVKDLVYIAIDGPAPRTKMEQQRHRRLKSSHENKIWDTNQITPGTGFMNRLNKFLEIEIKDFNIKTILSNSNEPGEGEHKIMDFLDENIDINDNSVVYGLDADLIMLSMIRKHKIFLLRERTEYNIEGLIDPYVYLNINFLKKYIIEEIKKSFVNNKISDKIILIDYLFICFLIGNDFIITSPCNNIRYGGLPFLIRIYCELQEEYSGIFCLIDNKKINNNNFCKFIQKVSEKEKNSIDTILKKRYIQQKRNKNKYSEYLEKIKSIEDISKHTYKDFDSQNEYEFNNFSNFSPLIFRNDEDIIFKNDNYRMKYYIYNIYNTFEYNPSYKMVIEENINEICQEYFKSIQWTFNYYFTKCKSWRWYYRYNYAPLMIDFSKYLSTIKDKDETQFEKDEPYKPEEQLKIVLPHQGDGYMYPFKTPIYSLFKSYLWECHEILPHEKV